jgi:predicted DNA-binding antitoxin AbrB/MazE fold protein
VSQLVEAIFENGVFKPLQHIPMKEHQKVEIRIISVEGWTHRFNRIIEKIHLQSSKYSSDEIEEDISQSIKDVRGKKYDR